MHHLYLLIPVGRGQGHTGGWEGDTREARNWGQDCPETADPPPVPPPRGPGFEIKIFRVKLSGDLVESPPPSPSTPTSKVQMLDREGQGWLARC